MDASAPDAGHNPQHKARTRADRSGARRPRSDHWKALALAAARRAAGRLDDVLAARSPGQGPTPSGGLNLKETSFALLARPAQSRGHPTRSPAAAAGRETERHHHVLRSVHAMPGADRRGQGRQGSDNWPAASVALAGPD